MPTPLAPDRILGEVADLWTKTGTQGVPETEQGVLRACSLTLVVLIHTGQDAGEDTAALQDTLRELMPEHPARTILVWLRPEQREPAVRVTAQCWLPFGQRQQICCEQIEITAPESSLEGLASVISPLAAADLPLVLWCRSRRVFERRDFGALAAISQKVIVDSSSWPDPRAKIERLAGMAARGIALGDLSWTRLTRWREMLSRIFENATYAAQLPEISSVRVRFPDPELAILSRYLGAWLVTALESVGTRPELSLEPGSAVLRVELTAPGFRVELARESDRLVTTVDGLSSCTSLPVANDAALLQEELAIIRRDPIFEQTLATAARL